MHDAKPTFNINNSTTTAVSPIQGNMYKERGGAGASSETTLTIPRNQGTAPETPNTRNSFGMKTPDIYYNVVIDLHVLVDNGSTIIHTMHLTLSAHSRCLKGTTST